MKLGTESKGKTAVLGILALLGGYMLYSNVLSGPSPAAPDGQRSGARQAGGETPLAFSPAGAGKSGRGTPGGQRARPGEFHPVLLDKRPENRPDPTKIDPALHLELLARLQEVKADDAGRNLFQFGAPPPPPQEQRAKQQLPAGPEPLVPQKLPAADLPPVAPAPPPPPFKYWALSTVRASGKRTAIFLEGETIMIAAEGDLLEKRYRVVRIGPTSVALEDIQLKREQTLQLAEEVNAPG